MNKLVPSAGSHQKVRRVMEPSQDTQCYNGQHALEPKLLARTKKHNESCTVYCSFPRHVKNTLNSVNGLSIGETVWKQYRIGVSK